MDAFVIIICLLISVYGFFIYRRTKDIFNPISMFIWPITLGYIIFLFIYYDESIKNETLVLYSFGILAFVGGFCLHRIITRYPLAYNEDVCRKELVIGETFFSVLKIIALLGIIATILYVYRTAFAGPYGSNVVRNLRYMGNYENSRSFISTYGIVVAKFVLYIIVYQVCTLDYKQNRKWIPFLVVGIVFGFMATVARTEFIEVVVAVYYIYSLKNRALSSKLTFSQRLKERWRALLLLVIIITVFIYVADKTEKIGSSNIFNTEFFFFRYAGLELKNFNSYILGNSFSTLGYHSLGIVGKLLSAFNLGPNNELFINIAQIYHGPVCSFIAAPYADFGLIGIILTMFAQGLLHSYVYMKSMRSGGYWSILYTTCIYSDLMAFYAFQYMMSSQVYILLLIILVHLRVNGTSITYVKSIE